MFRETNNFLLITLRIVYLRVKLTLEFLTKNEKISLIDDLNAIKADLKTRKLGKIGRLVKNYHTGLNYISKEAYYKEESESAFL